MKKMKWVLGTLLLAIVPVLAWVGVAQAQHFATTIEDDQTVYSSVYSAGKDINIKGTVYGDVFCTGQQITISATVYGDVICAGLDVTISGKVEGDVRLAGQLVTVSGEVGKNATIAAVSFSLDAAAKVGQDLTANGENLNIKGSTGRDLVTNGNSLALNGAVGRNLRAANSNIDLKEGARVGGNFHYVAQRDAKLAQGAQIVGQTNHEMPRKEGGFNITTYLYAVVSLTLVASVLALLFPRFIRRNNEQLKAAIPKTMLTGVVGMFMLFALCIGLLVSLVGIPLALVVLLAGVIGAVLSGPIVAHFIGTLVLRKKEDVSPILAMMVGAPILITLYHLPLIGFVVLLLAFWLGFGAVIQTIRPYVGAFADTNVPRKATSKSTKKKK